MSAPAVEQLGENRVRLTVDVPPEQVRHAVDHALDDLSESVKIPGFRKGKIPKQVLVSRLGKDRIYAEAVDSHIGGWFWSAAMRSRIRPVTDPAYEFELPGDRRRGVELHGDRRGAAAPRHRRLDDARGSAHRGGGAAGVRGRRARGAARVGRRARSRRREARPGGRHAVVDLVDSEGEAQRDTVVELGGGRIAPEIEAALLGATAGETKEVSFGLADGASPP